VLKIHRKRLGSHLFFYSIPFFLPLISTATSPSPPENFEVESALGLEMIWVDVQPDFKPTTYTKGSPVDENGHRADEHQHLVSLTKSYYLGKFEVRQAEYEAVLRASNPYKRDESPSGFDSPEQPVENISWDDALYFTERLNDLEKAKGNLPKGWAFTLPTEAEWEYACRAGSSSAYSFGDSLELNQSNFRLTPDTENKPKPVGQYEPNAFGFYDMHGNVSEWCSDWYFRDFNGSYLDPTGPTYIKSVNGDYRDPQKYIFYDPLNEPSFILPKKVCRGGSFNDDVLDQRSARRFPTPIEDKWTHIGFRLALKKIETNSTLEYATTGSPVTAIFGGDFEMEVVWEDNGDSPVYSISQNNLAELLQPNNNFSIANADDHMFVCIKSFYDDTFSSLSLSDEHIPGLGYAAYFCYDNGLGEWVYDKDDRVGLISADDLANFLNNSNADLLGHATLAWPADPLQQDFIQPYYTQSISRSMISLRSEHLSGTFSEFLNQANHMGNGWMRTKWFGYYFVPQFPWVFHENLGWTYIYQTQSDNAWIFRDHLGWGWTSAPDWWFRLDAEKYKEANQTASFPYLYRHGYDENDTKVWTFLNPASSQTILYDFQENDWFDLDQSVDINGSIVPQLGGTVSGYGKYHRWEKVTLSVEPADNYDFLYWGNNQSQTATYEFFATKSQKMHASFSPTLSGSPTSQTTEQIFADILSIRDDLDDIEKSRALFEFLFTGKSPTAGVK
jgi:formylglycine-generating enzyme required for sulfatase activity